MARKVQHNKDYHALSDSVLNFVISCFYIKNKFEKMNEKEQKMHFRGI